MPSRVIILAAVLMTGGPGLDFDGSSFVLNLAPGQALGAEGNTSLAAKVKNAPANTWVEIPNSALMRVAPKPKQFPKTWAVYGPSSVVMAWCGAAFDSKRDRLVVWGGGHADYHGNELYAFDVRKMAWERLTDPFPNPVKDREVNADGTPNSRHTYGGLAYLAHADRFFGLGGSLAGVGFAKCDRTWTYDFDAKKWENRQADGCPKVTRFARNGVFGRWRYVAGVKAFITVSDAGGNVFFYKHTAGDGRAAKAASTKVQFRMKTYTYKRVGNLKIEADVYRGDDTRPRPVLVWLHGGALMMGSKKWVQPDLKELCRSEGYCLVSANYRLAPQAKLPQIIEDLRDLMKWINEKGPKLFHADASRVVVAGSSAGGYLTMMTGIIEPRPKGLVAYYGYGDVDGPWYTTPSAHYRKRPLISKEDAYKGMTPEVVTEPVRGGLNRSRLYRYFRQNGLWTKEVTGFDPATEKKKLDPYCPVRNITAKYPPIVMIHGTADTDVPCRESLDMAEQLKKSKVRHEMFAIPGAGHGLGGGDRRLVDKAMARARKFIQQHLARSPTQPIQAKSGLRRMGRNDKAGGEDRGAPGGSPQK